MKRALLVQIDGKQPNLALMRLAAHCRLQNATVELRRCPTVASVQRMLGDEFDAVYASAIFERSRPVCEALRRVYPDAIIGGTGWSLAVTLESLGVGSDLDYSIYPHYQNSIGFTQRGCRLSCEFCVVPRKEGGIATAQTVAQIWRGPPHPKNVLLLDNDFFGGPAWRERAAELRDGGFKVCFNQGVNARMISEEAAEALASLNTSDDQFKTRRLYTAWDSREDEQVLFRGLNRLKAAGIRPDHVMVYMLVGYWAGETEEDWLYRQRRLREWGARPYPMPYHRTPLTVGFQRWVVGAYDKRVPWPAWKGNRCRPEGCVERGMTPLPLFDSQEGRP